MINHRWRHGATFLTLAMFCTGAARAPLEAEQPDTSNSDQGGSAEGQIEDGFSSLFDGKWLSGWEGPGYWFRVEQGSIIAGRDDQKIPHNFFLATTREFSDFDLRLQVKAIGDRYNGGIQFRSRRVANSEEVSGYQADVGMVTDGSTVWGALYDESRRRKMLATPDPDLIARLLHKDDWNDYRIVAVGQRIELFINGQRVVEYDEPDDSIPRDGVMALQIHSGPANEIWYRHLRIKPL